jgi:hypothetical protein
VGTTYPSGALEIARLFSGVLVYHFDQLHILIFLVTCCDVLYDFRVSNVHDIRLTPICFIGIRVLYIMLFVFSRPEHLSLPPLFNKVHIALSFVL